MDAQSFNPHLCAVKVGFSTDHEWNEVKLITVAEALQWIANLARSSAWPHTPPRRRERGENCPLYPAKTVKERRLSSPRQSVLVAGAITIPQPAIMPVALGLTRLEYNRMRSEALEEVWASEKKRLAPP